jgi:hypothetical protein
MWHLRGYDIKIKQWSEHGDFHNIADAARRIRELEGNQHAALLLSANVDPTAQTTDAKILSRLSCPAENGYYLLERTVQ